MIWANKKLNPKTTMKVNYTHLLMEYISQNWARYNGWKKEILYCDHHNLLKIYQVLHPWAAQPTLLLPPHFSATAWFCDLVFKRGDSHWQTYTFNTMVRWWGPQMPLVFHLMQGNLQIHHLNDLPSHFLSFYFSGCMLSSAWQSCSSPQSK